jgi:hypothetical protein
MAVVQPIAAACEAGHCSSLFQVSTIATTGIFSAWVLLGGIQHVLYSTTLLVTQSTGARWQVWKSV